MNALKSSLFVLSLALVPAAAPPAAAGDLKPYPTFANPAERARAYASVDLVRDCQKPAFPKLDKDGKVLVDGMSAVERDVCLNPSRTRQ